MTTDDELRSIARKRAQDRVGFLTHLGAFIMVNLGLFLVWYFTGGGFPWFLIVVLFWGIGLVAHAISVYAGQGYLDRLTEAEYQRLRSRR